MRLIVYKQLSKKRTLVRNGYYFIFTIVNIQNQILKLEICSLSSEIKRKRLLVK